MSVIFFIVVIAVIVGIDVSVFFPALFVLNLIMEANKRDHFVRFGKSPAFSNHNVTCPRRLQAAILSLTGVLAVIEYESCADMSNAMKS